MIVRRTFSHRDPMLPPEKQFKADPEVEKEYNVDLEIEVIETKNYKEEFSKHYSVEKKTIKEFKKDILDGHLYDDGPSGGDTHYLSKFSKEKKHHTLSKCINTIDRLNYIVYPPKLFEDEGGNIRYIQKVVLTSCKEHERYGVGTYSETEE